MDTKKLRQKILDLAIHGKLVPQDPNEEPASVLLERIRAEKERLIKEGKIKRSRKTAKTTDTRHYEQDVPFEVPKGWEWCRLGEVNDIARGGSPRPIKDYLTNSKNGVNWIKIGDTTKDGKYINSVKEKIRVEGVTKSRMVHKGDFLLTNSMSFGRPYILNVDGCIHDGWLVISPIGKVYTSDFLYYLISSSFALNQFTQVASGGVVSNLNSDKVADTIFPIAPLSEQQRIVEEIERWFKLIDVIEQGKADLRTTITQTKSKILNLAIHGKLVPQDPNDKSALELLKRINPKAQITCDNEHNRKLPPNWTFTKIKNLFEINPKTQADDNLDVAFVPMANISDGYRNLFTYDKRKWRSIKSGFTHFQNGDIAVAKISPCLENRKSVVFSSLPNGLGAGTTELHIFRSLGIDVFYALYFFKTNNFINQCVGTFNGVVGQQRIGKAIIENIGFPLPPLSEQKRIVRKIEDLFSLINVVEKQLEE